MKGSSTSNMHFHIMGQAAAKNKVTLVWKKSDPGKKNTDSLIDGLRQTHTHFEYTRLSLEETGNSDPSLQGTALSPGMYPLFIPSDFHTMFIPCILKEITMFSKISQNLIYIFQLLTQHFSLNC